MAWYLTLISKSIFFYFLTYMFYMLSHFSIKAFGILILILKSLLSDNFKFLLCLVFSSGSDTYSLSLKYGSLCFTLFCFSMLCNVTSRHGGWEAVHRAVIQSLFWRTCAPGHRTSPVPSAPVPPRC